MTVELQSVDASVDVDQLRTGAEVIVETLEQLGVSHIFGIPGGNVIPFYDALHSAATLRGVLVRHEEGAVHAAHGYAVARAGIGVCVATSGPGATNLVTGLAEAFADSAPVLAITGAVFSSLQGTDAFQEADIFGMTEGVTKHSFRVTHPDDIAQTLFRAHHIATTGRPGPVLVDITKDAQQGIAAEPYAHATDDFMAEPSPSEAELASIMRVLRSAERPLIVAGTGILRSNATAELRTFADLTGAVVMTSGAAHGVIGDDDAHTVGVIGSRLGDEALASCDALITVGLRSSTVRSLADRVSAGSPIVQLDVDPLELLSARDIVAVAGDARETMSALIHGCRSSSSRSSIAWFDAPTESRQGILAPEDLASAAALRTISMSAPAGSAFVAEHPSAGWLSDALAVSAGSSLLTSGGFVRHGFAVPAALGAKFARPEQTVWAMTDAAGFQVSSRELATAAVEGMPIIVVVVSPAGRSVPDVALLGEAMGAVGIVVEHESEIAEAVETALRADGRSVVIDLRLGARPTAGA